VRFSDPEFPRSGRDALYYVRALEEPSAAINGRPLHTRFDREGNPVSISLCGSPEAGPDCLGEVRERAWSSPIFVDQPLACDVARERGFEIAGEAPGVLREGLAGASYVDAGFSVEIRGADGRELYAFRAPFAAFFTSDESIRSEPLHLLRRQAWEFVNWQASSETHSASDALPAYRPGRFAWELGSAEILADRATYERLRAARIPVVWHSAIGPAMRAVAYDARARRAVALLDSRL
jgi:hypothetical protein